MSATVMKGMEAAMLPEAEPLITPEGERLYKFSQHERPRAPTRVEPEPTMALKYRELLEALADLPARFEIAADDAAEDAIAVGQWNRVKAARQALLSRHAD